MILSPPVFLNNVLPQSEKDLGSELIFPPAQRQDKDKQLRNI
jgi:hypothetical protein